MKPSKASAIVKHSFFSKLLAFGTFGTTRSHRQTPSSTARRRVEEAADGTAHTSTNTAATAMKSLCGGVGLILDCYRALVNMHCLQNLSTESHNYSGAQQPDMRADPQSTTVIVQKANIFFSPWLSNTRHGVFTCIY